MAKNQELELSIRIGGDVDSSLAKAINSTYSQVGGLAKGIGELGKAGLASMAGLAAGAAAVIVKTTASAQTFEGQMADVAKYVDGITDATGHIDTERYNEMADVILRLSTQIPYTAEELTRLAAAAGESGYAFEDIVHVASDGTISGFLKDVAMAGSALDISADQAGDWAAKWEVALNMSHEQVMSLFDQINFLAANTATSAAEIAEVVNKTGSVGNIAGMSPSYTAALADALLSMGVDTARAATSVKNIYTNMSLGASATDRMQKGWSRIGMTAEAVASAMQVDAPNTMKEVFKAIGELPDDQRLATISDIFGRWPLESAAKIAENMQAFQDAIGMVEGTEWQGSLEREFIVKASTGEAIDQMFGSAVNRFEVTIGNNFLPVKKELALMGIDILNGITDNLPEMADLADSAMPVLKSMIEGIGDAAQAALPLIQSLVDYLANNGPSAARAVAAVAAAFAAMTFAPSVSSIAGSMFGANGMAPMTLAAGKSFAGNTAKMASGVGNTVRAASFGAQMANSSMARANGESGGMLQTISNGLLGAAFGIKNQKALTGKGSDKAWWGRALGVADQIVDAKEGGAGAIFTGLLGNTQVGKYATGIANTKIGGGILKTAAGAGGVTKEILTGIADYTGLAGAVTGAAGIGSAALSKVGSAAPVQAAGKVAGGIAGGLGSIVSFGGAVSGPLVSGFMTLLGTFGPVIAGLGSVIAVISILGDNLGGIQDVILRTFGQDGLNAFNQFVSTITGFGTAIQNALSLEGLTNIKAMITQTFGTDAGNAFGTLIPLIQTVTGVFSQIVDLGVNHIKPMMLEVFGYASETLFPALIPLLSTVIGLIGTTLVNAVKLIIDVAGTVLPAVEPIITGIVGLISGIANTAVSVVNFIIRALNAISFTVPAEWENIPVVGQFAGQTLGFNLQEVSLPQFAKGGFTKGLSIAGEAGTEAVISFQRSVRGSNIENWIRAGRMLGVTGRDAAEAAGPNAVYFANGGFTDGSRDRVNNLIDFSKAYANYALRSNGINTAGDLVSLLWTVRNNSMAGDGSLALAATSIMADVAPIVLERAFGKNDVTSTLSRFAETYNGGTVLTSWSNGALTSTGVPLRVIQRPSETTVKELPVTPTGTRPGGSSGGGGNRPVQYVFSPTITFYGSGNTREELEAMMPELFEKFKQWNDEIRREEDRTSYA